MKGRAAILIICAGVVMAIRSGPQQNALYRYRPVMYTSVAGVSQELEVFPIETKAFRIPLPFALETMTYSSDGKALYGTRQFGLTAPRIGGLFRIEFTPTRASLVPGSDRLTVVYSVAVAAQQSKIIELGADRDGKTPGCSIFELDAATGKLRMAAENYACHPFDPSIYAANISVSPDGSRATATRNSHLELIDLRTGKVTALEDASEGSWSPDGRWLAVLKGETTILMDPSTLTQRRVLGSTLLKWSPDSHYLLNKKSKLICGLGEAGTLEMVDIETGKRTEVESSRCLIDRNALGWISSEVTR